ncbi:hypothetical protein [Ferrimicrobium sp.]|uniref:hypothetical protein n=1 Tax=Ferrimicrobium sp. TaxID=2926050 RepID=UPI002628EB5C|nr:hypothetical protein [Ferrimicrobium sp.]
MTGDPTALVTALVNVGTLIVGWYPNAHFGQNEILTWIYLLDGFDPALFVPAIVEYAKQNPDWPPSAPKFRIAVEELTRRRKNEDTRRRTQEMLVDIEGRLIEEACSKPIELAEKCVDSTDF